MDKKIIRALQRAGLDAEIIEVLSKNGKPVKAVRVDHNYPGLYRDDEARKKKNAAFAVAAKYGYIAEDRNTATWIY